MQGDRVVGSRFDLHLHEDLSPLGELDCVANQVDEHLPQPSGIADAGVRHVRQHVADQLESLLFGAQRERLHEIGEVIADREGNRFELQLAHLDLGEIEDVVQDREQGVGGALHHRQILALFGRERRVERELGHADDAVERRTNLVAHVGEELALGAAGLFGDASRGGKFGGAVAHLAIEILGHRAQLGVETLTLHERLLELLVGIRQPRLHPVHVLDQRCDFRRRLRREA